MDETFYFYDLETSGIDPRRQRIMQFAGQRTNLKLEPIGDPDDFLVRLTDDVLPEPEAVLITGITPQMTHQDGISEDEFLAYFDKSIATPGTIIAGFNSIRFDNEFIRYAHYRNLYDPYGWEWRDGKSKFDMLDVVRMTRALRPEGIKWPVGDEGQAVNRLEEITSLNGLEHSHAHNAMSDVLATIELARLIRDTQPRLFDFALKMRDKKAVEELVASGEPFVYTTGRYEAEYEKTSVAIFIGYDENRSSAIVYDLRYDPSLWAAMSVDQIVAKVQERSGYVPFKALRFNKAPAIAPLSVLDQVTKERLKIDMASIEKHKVQLGHYPDFLALLQQAMTRLKEAYIDPKNDAKLAEERLYDGFISNEDARINDHIHRLSDDELIEYEPQYSDPRLQELFWLYKIRQRPKAVLAEDRSHWADYLAKRLSGEGGARGINEFVAQLIELKKQYALNADKVYLIDELMLYAESIVPS